MSLVYDFRVSGLNILKKFFFSRITPIYTDPGDNKISENLTNR